MVLRSEEIDMFKFFKATKKKKSDEEVIADKIKKQLEEYVPENKRWDIDKEMSEVEDIELDIVPDNTVNWDRF